MLDNRKRDFKEFLEEVHIEIFPQVIDDDLPDHFSDWLCEMEQDDMIDYANLHQRQQTLLERKLTMIEYSII